MMQTNFRIVNDFKKNKEYYCDKLGFEFQESVNENNEKVLILKYENILIDFILRSSIKDFRKDVKDDGTHFMLFEVQNLELEKQKIESNNIQIFDYITDKEFSFLDCNEFEIKYIQYEIAHLQRDLI